MPTDREKDAADERQILKGMCLECADDLDRWARAFDAQDEPLMAQLLDGLAHRMRERASVISD
jgi:hypothetical protein